MLNVLLSLAHYTCTHMHMRLTGYTIKPITDLFTRIGNQIHNHSPTFFILHSLRRPSLLPSSHHNSDRIRTKMEKKKKNDLRFRNSLDAFFPVRSFRFFSFFSIYSPPSFIQMTHLPFFDFVLLMERNGRQQQQTTSL